MTSPFSVSVVLPGYNEEANIEATVAKCRKALGALTQRYEIIVVDDGSTDSMPAIADRLQKTWKEVHVIHNPVNLGVGISLLVGMKAATCDLVLHNSMDYPFHMDDLNNVLTCFPEADVAVIVRNDRCANSPYRRLTSLTNYCLLKILFWVPMRDMNFVQVYKREVIQSMRVKGKSPAFVTPELLIRSRDAGFKIAQVQAPFYRRFKGKASYGKPRDILWTLADMISFWIERNFQGSAQRIVGRTGTSPEKAAK